MGDDIDIRFTTHGVAHIRASGWHGLGYGQGWAIANDHLPTIADQIVKVRSERARFHGRGAGDGHLASDLGYRSLGVTERAPLFRDDQPAHVRALISGYVAGYNRSVTEQLAADRLPEWCAGAEWIRPIGELDLYAYLCDIALMGSGRNLAQLIGWAQPPGPEGPVPAPGDLGGQPPASNGWALGGDVSASGGGMVLANPHFPWGGEGRFWECHLMIPGELDVYGVSLLGAPGVQMGFNEHLGWTHTFSRGHRFTVYQLALDAAGPTRYRYGDEVRDMTSIEATIKVLEDDGSVHDEQRQLWSTHHGPMLNMPVLGWGNEVAFSYRDANLDNTEVLQQFLGMCTASSVEELRSVFHRVKGLPWVNTLAADDTGAAWYCDASATPSLSPAATERFLRRLDEDLIAALAFENRIAMLDGSEPDDEWVVHADARSPGLEPPEHLPELHVRDVAVNANDSHWLSHPGRPLEGYPVLCGLERTPRSLRTRQNLRRAAELAQRRSVTLDDLIEAVFDNRSLSGELLRDQVVERLRAAGTAQLEHRTVDLTPAADVLEGWDLTAGLEAVGVALWREFMSEFSDNDWKGDGSLFGVGWDAADPVSTPHSLAAAPAEGHDPVIGAVVAALDALDTAGIVIDAPLRDVQWAQRGERRVAVHGGGEAEGLLNVLAPTGALASTSLDPVPEPPAAVPGRVRTGLASGGYQVTYGTSFVMALALTPDGPQARGLLAYGQSGDPRSAHHDDGTEAYATSQLRPLLFRDAEIEADPHLRRVTLQTWGDDGLDP